MTMIRFWAWLVIGFALALAGCSDATPDYRYRLTVEVETPDGLRSGSSVIEVDQRMVRPGSSPASRAIQWKIKGEAVAVDLPDGRVLFALLRSESDTSWAARAVLNLAPKQKGESFAERFDDVLALRGKGPIALPRMLPAHGPLDARSAYPMLVTFGDLDEPTSVALVDPDDLAASFGEGYALKRITVQMTDDPVTTGIDERLGWLPDYYDKMLDGQRLNTIYTENRLANDLHQGAFSSGVLR